MSDLAFRLCDEWQRRQCHQSGFAVDELNAFMAGVKAAIEECAKVAENKMDRTRRSHIIARAIRDLALSSTKDANR